MSVVGNNGENRWTLQFTIVLLSTGIGLIAIIIDIILDYYIIGNGGFVDYFTREIETFEFINRRYWVILFPITGLIMHFLIVSRRIEIRRKETQLSNLMNSINEMIVIYKDDRIVEVNPSFLHTLKFENNEIAGRHIQDFFPKYKISEEEGSGEFLWKTKNGTFREVEVLCSRIPYNNHQMVIAKDITDRKRMHEALESTRDQLLQSQKMEIVARFTNSIIHDFNNLLTIIRGNLYRIEQKADKEISTYMKSIIGPTKDAIEQSEDLIKQLLAYSKNTRGLKQDILDINEIISETKSIISSLVSKNVDVELDMNKEPIPINANRSQLKQVLMNLVINSKEAMPDGGKIRIKTETKDVSDVSDNQFRKEYGILSISDTGKGMSKSEIDNCFEPFYSTKEYGSGMGLFTVYSIVQQIGGKISIQSEPGHGTTFNLFFPVDPVD